MLRECFPKCGAILIRERCELWISYITSTTKNGTHYCIRWKRQGFWRLNSVFSSNIVFPVAHTDHFTFLSGGYVNALCVPPSRTVCPFTSAAGHHSDVLHSEQSYKGKHVRGDRVITCHPMWSASDLNNPGDITYSPGVTLCTSGPLFACPFELLSP